MKKVMAFLAALLMTAAVHPTLAHNAGKPEHGGVVQVVGDMSFELVTGGNGVELFVEDDGDEINSAEYAAKLTVVEGAAKSEVPLTPATGNKFEGKGVKIAKGAKVAVLLTLKDKHSKIGANFIIS